ncbi:MAG: lysylphosphatidylglycerol synthase transmembrane domain-containing protein [Bacteroidales bacterium]
MKKTVFQVLKVIAFLALGVLLLFFAFRGIALDELKNTLRHANFWWIGLSIFFGGCSYFFRARRWILLIKPLGYKPAFWNTYHSLMLGYLANFVLPRLGEITRCVTLGRREKIPVDALIGTVIVERVIDVIMLFLILLILLVSWMDKFGTFFREQVFNPLMQKVTGTFGGTWQFWVMLAVAAGVVILVLYLLRKKLAQFTLVIKVKKFIRGLLDGLRTIFRMERNWEFIIHSVLIWILYIFMTWMVVFALKETSGLKFVDGMFLLVIGGLGMAAPVTAGFGAYHWITSRGLVFVYGLPLEVGGAYAILAHESNSLLIIILGFISYLLFAISRKKK